MDSPVGAESEREAPRRTTGNITSRRCRANGCAGSVCVGVVCELDSVLFLFVLSFFVFLVGIWLALFLGLVFLWFCLESLILAQDERWRRA